MTKREFDEFKESDCPCGKGQVTRHVESTDYRFTSVHISYSLDCPNCSQIWRLDHATLVHRESEAPYLAAKQESDRTRHELYELSQALVKAYCANQSFKSKKAELEHLQELGLCDATYAYYTKGRREGKQMFEMAYGLKNKEWLKRVAASLHQEDLLSALILADQEARAKTELAAKSIIRRTFR